MRNSLEWSRTARELDRIERVRGSVGGAGVPDFGRDALLSVVLVHAYAAVAVGIAGERAVFVVAMVVAIAERVDFLGNLPFGVVDPLGHIPHRVEHGGEVSGGVAGTEPKVGKRQRLTTLPARKV